MNREKRAEIFCRLRAANPSPRSELSYKTPFELLVSVVLSAQATDTGVNRVTPALFKVANTPEKMLKLGEEKLKSYINSIGLFNSKARHLIQACRELVEQHAGKVPRERKALEALPGVGRKTANVVLSNAFGEPTIAVDTHVFRVANRTHLARGKTPRQVEDRLMRLTPDEFKQHAHHWLILHGRYICKARKPMCPQCPIEDLCEYKHKTPT